MQPGVVTTAPVQREIVGALRSSRTRVVVRWLDPRAEHAEPNGRRSSGVHILDRLPAAHYRPVPATASTRCWRPRAAAREPPPALPPRRAAPPHAARHDVPPASWSDRRPRPRPGPGRHPAARPAQIGLYGVVSTTVISLIALKRVGIDEAFVQQEEPDQEREFQYAFTLELGLSVAMA